jgi:hypothetical protein
MKYFQPISLSFSTLRIYKSLENGNSIVHRKFLKVALVGLAKNDAVKYSNELFFFFVKWMYVKTPLVTTNKYHNILRHNAEWGLKRRHFLSQQN